LQKLKNKSLSPRSQKLIIATAYHADVFGSQLI